MGKWKAAAASMLSLEKKYAAERVSERRSVHKNLVYRALPLLYEYVPQAEDIFKPHLDVLIDMACAPDREGDYEKGMGRHYYCGVNSFGRKLSPVGGYYKNGIGRFSRSARTMFEEDYTMSLTLWNAGFHEQGIIHLARAVHMISDMNCLPHATKMTYYSFKKCIHQSYECLAKTMYPDSVPEQRLAESDLHLFDDRSSFGNVLNRMVEQEATEVSSVKTEPVKSIMARLYSAEKAVAALLFRFISDIDKAPEEAHYITNGMKFSLFRGMPAVEAHITAEGIQFINDSVLVRIKFGFGFTDDLFRAAHRHDGEFTFSPVHDLKGRAIVKEKNKLAAFNPCKNTIFVKPL
jgi:hypothetical protein